jgi:pimeloyl-ACP methyl ester carboxylesterase
LNPIDYNKTPPYLTGRVLERLGCPIHYWTGGVEDAPLLVFLHGATMDHRMFNAQVEAFAGRYRLLVWDARGHGASQPIGKQPLTIMDYVEDLQAVLDHEGADAAAIIGQSMGGYIAQHLYRVDPQRFHAMVLIGATPVIFPVAFHEMLSLQLTLPMFYLWPFGSLTRLTARSTTSRPEIVPYAMDAVRRTGRDNFLVIWRAVGTAVRRQGYPDLNIRVPLLLTHGEKDKAGTVARDSERWAEQDQRIQYRVIPGAGHNANQDDPVYFNQLLAIFLENVFSMISRRTL